VADERLYFGNHIPFLAHIGVRPGKMSPDQVSAKLDFSASLANGGGYMHGGSLMSALDFAMSAVARSSALCWSWAFGAAHLRQAAHPDSTAKLSLHPFHPHLVSTDVPTCRNLYSLSCRIALPRHRRPTISRRDFVPWRFSVARARG
jgi:hypothetical protein